MDLLINIKKSEDINRYIKYIEQKIKIAEDNNNLSEVKDLLKNNEIVILEKYLPEQLSLEEVNKIIDEAFDKIKPTSMKDMKDLMAYINPLVKGKADMGYVSKSIKDRLN